ncbi:MAG: YebC/PmpR family DNA-binding transcriptional regulator, partial [Gammaproteobacteria bacterium]|nr:YebC/PmpR family DNA-binding transcriptional regulator [Gammaproteobacteria bacterium]
VLDVALDAGAEDLETEDDGALAVITPWEALGAVADALEAAALVPDHKEVTMVPSTLQDCDEAQAATLLRLIDALEELDDVQNVYTNARLPDGAG